MSVTKDFVIKVAVGLEGVAVMEIKETISPHSVLQVCDIHPALIQEDIKQVGADEWLEWSIGERPVEPGTYTFRGSVRFDEDSSDYSATCDEL